MKIMSYRETIEKPLEDYDMGMTPQKKNKKL